MAKTGSASARIDSTRTPTSPGAPSDHAWVSTSHCWPTLSQAVAATARGRATTINTTDEQQHAVRRSSTHADTTVRAHQVSADSLRQRCGSSPVSVGLMCEYRSGTPVRSARMW